VLARLIDQRRRKELRRLEFRHRNPSNEAWWPHVAHRTFARLLFQPAMSTRSDPHWQNSKTATAEQDSGRANRRQTLVALERSGRRVHRAFRQDNAACVACRPFARCAMTKTIRRLLSCAFAVVAVVAVHGQAGKIRVFVGPQTRDGFVDVDQAVLDSIEDVQNEFRRSKDFALVETRDEATLVLDIVARRTAGESGSVGVPIGTMTMFLPIKRRAIDSVLHVAAYEKAITSEDENNDHWKAAAKQVVKDVAAWVKANRSRLP
jgi:hypothetical protein